MTIRTTATLPIILAGAAIGVALAPVSLADDACGPAMYFNVTTNQCEYYPAVGPGPLGPGPVGPGPVGPGPVGPGPVGPGPVGPGPVGPGPVGPGR
ncbi:MAG: hypothetical protein KDB50_11835 [Mycobacterium sp.]|nr:hypothetical protein [Mycobacterium sp.]